MTFNEPTSTYIHQLIERLDPAFYVPRFFRSADEWLKWSTYDWRSHRFGSEPGLTSLLQNSRLVIIGEPGSGKSTVASAAVRIAVAVGYVPVFVSLRSYRGELDALVRQSMPKDVRAYLEEHPELPRLYVLDGFDEIPSDTLSPFLQELAELEQRSTNRTLLTSRQAFYMHRRDIFPTPRSAYYILGLNDEDIDRFIEHRGVDRAAFLQQAELSHLSTELGNPFALNSFLERFAAKGNFGQTRSESVRYVVEASLQTNPTSDPASELQSLRMLALAMEICAKNELTEDEARSVLEHALRMSPDEAATHLDELTRSILVRTQNGYAFQMRSFGEYLAGSDLAENEELDKILDPILVGDTRQPQDSWRNAVTYLVEQNRAVRRYFIRNHPDWLLTASTNVFSQRQKSDLVRTLFQRMRTNSEYLFHHPIIYSSELARFVTEEAAIELRTALSDSDDVAVANALLLLGSSGDRSIADIAFAAALNPARSSHLRHSALAALARVGSPDMIPALLKIDDWSDSAANARVSAASALMDTVHVQQVLEALARTDSIISSSFDRFQELGTPEDIEAVVDALLNMREDLGIRRLYMYLDRVWAHLPRLWNGALTVKVARILERFATEAGDNDLVEHLADALLKTTDHGASVGRELAATAVREGRGLRGFPRSVPRLVALEDVRQIERERGSDQLLSYLRAFGSDDVRRYLFESIPTDEKAVAKFRQEQEKWERQRTEQVAKRDRLREKALKTQDAPALLETIAQLEQEHWPDLPAEQTELLRVAVDGWLHKLELADRIVWTGEGTWSWPKVLPLLLRLIDRYRLKLTADVPLVETLRGAETEVVLKYWRLHGLTPAALQRIEQVASDPNTANGALDGFVDFIARAPLLTAKSTAILSDIVISNRPERTRLSAMRGLVQTSDGRKILALSLKGLPDNLRAPAEASLIEHGHRPTIERRLRQLLDDPTQLEPDIDVPRHDHHLGWLQQIQSPEAWKSLTQLRKLALQKSLPGVTGLITNVMAGIDRSGVATVIRQQLELVPQDWQPYERSRALEYERDARILSAQTAPFDRVLERLDLYSTSGRYKFWVEGPTDVPAFEALLKNVPGGRKIRVQQIGGWSNVLAEEWSPRWLGMGCSLFSVIFDGDRAYDWSAPARPLRDDVKKVIAKLEAYEIEYHILERYGLENYFTQSAYERVLQKDLSAFFPLNPQKSVEKLGLPGYSKALNKQIAAETAFADLEGTDLKAILLDASDWVSDED